MIREILEDANSREISEAAREYDLIEVNVAKSPSLVNLAKDEKTAGKFIILNSTTILMQHPDYKRLEKYMKSKKYIN